LLAPRQKRRVAALALALLPARALRAAAPGLAAALIALAPPAAAQPADGYKLHMENGVKLYNDRNYPAAVAEFQAAYEARPNANPLVNIALCEKEQFRYHKAIAVLETALARHGEAMSPGDKKAAEDAIKDMRGLLGHVVVKVSPPRATLVVDGDELPPGAADRPIDLGPGAHRIEARADGFASGTQSVTVASGQTHVLTVELVPDKGTVTIVAPDPAMAITIDTLPVGTGRWTGLLSPGPHVVRMTGGAAPPYEAQFVVVPGQALEVKKGSGGVEVPPRKDALPLRRGLYVLATGSLLFSPIATPYFDKPDLTFGAGFGVRVGYQVNNTAGFDLTYQHSSVQTIQQGDETGLNSFRLISERVAAGLRLSTPGTMWRFVGTIAGGIVYDQLQWGDSVSTGGPISGGMVQPFCDKATNPSASCPDIHGFDAFGLIEAMGELDVDRVLIDLGVEAQFQSTGNISGGMGPTTFQRSFYGTRPIINVGPALRIGYRFW
jgi:hypothetical protein